MSEKKFNVCKAKLIVIENKKRVSLTAVIKQVRQKSLHKNIICTNENTVQTNRKALVRFDSNELSFYVLLSISEFYSNFEAFATDLLKNLIICFSGTTFRVMSV